MFDIGFWELLLVGVVALLVVGPDKLPGLVRTTGMWVGRIRHFASSVKDELEQEINRTEELKRLVNEQIEIAERNKRPDPDKPTVAVNHRPESKAAEEGEDKARQGENTP